METIKVGDILVCSFGYNCTFVEFFKVIELKNGFAKFYKIENETTEWDVKIGIGKKTSVDVPQKSTDKVLRRKIKISTSSSIHYEYIKIDDYSICHIWDGQPTYYNPYD
tara:strand:+ start:670 stop:996 length:327 start_codon:yes stop_codon:yes gene_type:complete